MLFPIYGALMLGLNMVWCSWPCTWALPPSPFTNVSLNVAATRVIDEALWLQGPIKIQHAPLWCLIVMTPVSACCNKKCMHRTEGEWEQAPLNSVTAWIQHIVTHSVTHCQFVTHCHTLSINGTYCHSLPQTDTQHTYDSMHEHWLSVDCALTSQQCYMSASK